MNQNQRKYALERVNAIKSVRLSKLTDAYSKSSRKITDKERLVLVKTGKVKLKSDVIRDLYQRSQGYNEKPRAR